MSRNGLDQTDGLQLFMLRSCSHQYCKLQRPVPLLAAGLICNFGIIELLFQKNGNMALIPQVQQQQCVFTVILIIIKHVIICVM